MNDPCDSGSTTASASETSLRPERMVSLTLPVDVRSGSLAIIATILSLYALRWASPIVVPILMGVMVSYALGPIVDRMHRWHLPRAVGATIVLSAILSGTLFGANVLNDQTEALIDSLPAVTQRVREYSQQFAGKTSAMQKVQQAATAIATVTQPDAPSSQASTRGSAPTGPVVTLASPVSLGVDIRSYVLNGTVGVFAFMGQAVVVFFLALFLMAAGDSFRRKIVRLAGPTLTQKKITVAALDEITKQIQRYLLVQIGLSVVVGLATGLVFFALGLNQSAVWGVVASVTNLIPYVGAVIVALGSTIVGLVQFGTPSMALMIGGSSLVVHMIVGNLLTPWWMGKASKMSPVAVFLAVLIFGWLWGVAGLLLGVPILLVIKSVCDRVEDLRPVGELLGA